MVAPLLTAAVPLNVPSRATFAALEPAMTAADPTLVMLRSPDDDVLQRTAHADE
jgi:hypothetical protein